VTVPLDEDFQTLARTCLLLSALAVGLHYHCYRLAAGLGRHRPHRRHREPQFVPELATTTAEGDTIAATATAAAATVLPRQDRQPIERDIVGVATISPRSLRDCRCCTRQSLQCDDDHSDWKRRQLFQHRADACICPDIVQGSGTEHNDDSSSRVSVRTDFQAPCEMSEGIRIYQRNLNKYQQIQFK